MIEENFNDRIVSSEDLPEEKVLEQTLRPQKFEDYIGQEKIKENLKVFIQAAKKRNETLEHVLLYGNPGLGKTTLAHIIAQEMGAGIKITSGPAIEKAGDLAAILTNLSEGDVLFIDEIHRLNKQIEEILYPAMEDYCLDIIIGKGPSAKTLRLDLPKFTMIGATTKIGLISSPLRDRFGATFRLDFYTEDEIQKILGRNAKILKTEIENPAALEIAKRSRRTPRVANRLLKRVRDFAEVKGDGTINSSLAEAALKALEIDQLGLDNVDRKIISTIIEKFAGGPVGLNTLAAATSEEMDTIEDIYEPFLIQLGFLERTPRGRKVTSLCYEHLSLSKPTSAQESLL